MHWVTKIGNLKSSLRFFELVFGFRVLRHEEFESGCEATCNGPYGGAWSKTMVGWGPEKTNFAFELTYNYGINGYESGDDVQFFCIACPEAVPRAQALGYRIEYDNGVPMICGPDNFKYKIIDAMPRAERFVAVVLKTSDVSKSQTYWCDVLGMKNLAIPPGCNIGNKRVAFGWPAGGTALVFVETGGEVDHALAAGRIANACDSVEPFFEAAKASGGTIMNPPITLSTPGKADVVVTILADPDGYEICFVGAEGFYDLAEPLYDLIDWRLRESRGADGAPPPARNDKKVVALTSEDQLQALAANGAKLIVVKVEATWCDACKKVAPFFASLAETHPACSFATVERDGSLGKKFKVTQIPFFMFFEPPNLDAPKVTCLGSDKVQLQATLDDCLKGLGN